MRFRVFAALASALASVMVFTSLPADALPATTKVTVHYQRFDGNYTGWNMWLWGDVSNTGAAYEFTGTDDFGKVGTWNVPTTAADTKIGFIVRTNAWAKDVSADRFITTFKAPGEAEIWLMQADPTINYTQPNSDPKIVSASLDSLNKITVQLNKSLTVVAGANNFTLTGSGNPVVTSVAVVGGGASGTNVSLTTDQSLSLTSTYTLSHPTYGSQTVAIGNVMNSTEFNAQFNYEGADLGNTYTAEKTDFRLWAPTATTAEILIYPSAANDAQPVVYSMTKSTKGTWTYSLAGDQHGTIYTYRVDVGGVTNEAVDPYVRAATVNGVRGVVVDLSRTNPDGFLTSTRPSFSGKPTDATFYELHVRDLSMDASSGISTAHKGKFLGLTEAGTKTPDGKSKTGVDAIVDLGVTHVQLLPIYDYKTVDENLNTQFNWGYDPQNYNVPEGSYSTQPTNPTNRITELKQTVQYLHGRKLRVIMDVVYNHVFNAAAHSFEKLVPGYFFRKNADGSYANGTGVGNETASERPMMRKFIVESIKYWATEYKLDGFRFDLMGIHDVTTMQQVREALTAIDPTILIIGEGWVMGALPSGEKAAQPNASRLPGIGMFNDGIRDGIKGSVFQRTDTGWASGKYSAKQQVQLGIVANTIYSPALSGAWGAISPGQSVNYVEAHDNLTLYDKLKGSLNNGSASASAITKVHRLSSSIIILGQGMPFIHAGQEFMRSKNGNDNSYNASDAVNSLKWTSRVTNASTVNYFKGLIAIRKAHPAFRMSTAATIKSRLKFLSTSTSMIAYKIDGKALGDSWKTIVVAHNAGTSARSVTLPVKGAWKIVVNSTTAGTKVLKTLPAKTGTVSVPAQSTMVLYL